MRIGTLLTVALLTALPALAAEDAVSKPNARPSLPASASATPASAKPAAPAAKADLAQDGSQEDNPVEAAVDLIRVGSIDAGIEELRKLGEQGHADAFYHLGEINRLGLDDKHKPSVPVAIMYYRLAAQQGNKQAALNLANLLFFESDHTQENVDEAMSYWQKYALKGDPESLYLLGMAYWNGEGYRLPDPIRGYGLVWLAATKGYTDAIKTRDAMQGQLSDEAQTRGRQYASALDKEGFSDQPIALYMVLGRNAANAQADDKKMDAAVKTPAGASDITAAPPTVADAGMQTPPSGETAVPEGKGEAVAPVADQEPEKITPPAPVQLADAGVSHADAKPEPRSAEPGSPAKEAAPSAPPAEAQATADDGKPLDWSKVWHLQVGVPMEREEINKLQKVVTLAHADIIKGLKSEVTESASSPGLYRLVFGPVEGLQGAVRRCISLKRAGYDCFARPPEQDDRDDGDDPTHQ